MRVQKIREDKEKKKLKPYLNKDAGNVEYNVNCFNNSTSFNEEGGNVGAGIGESLKKNKNYIGTTEWNMNEGREERIKMYRKYTGIDESFEITEDNIDDWAVKRVCVDTYRDYDDVKNEILGR